MMQPADKGALAVWSVALLAMVSTAFGQTASELVDLSGLRGGVIFLPRARDEGLALELARRDGFLVYAQLPDETRVQRLRAKAAESGLLAKTLYAGVGAADHLPLAERAASLVLVADLSGSDLTESRRRAWLQALAPRRGVAIFGSPSASQLDEGRLRTWLSGQPGVQVFRQGTGLWVSCRREADLGADQWPQKFYDASNARISHDQTFQPPFLPAWYALPMHLGYWGDTMVSANGRAYLVWANRAFNASVSLIARDIHSGFKLWERPFSWDEPRDNNRSGYFAGRSCLLADGDVLYLVDEADVLLLDGETGEELGRIEGPQGDGQIKWMGAEDGKMALLAGDADRYRTSSLQQACTNPVGRELASYDLRTRERLWTATEPSDVDQREVAILDGRVYYHAIGSRVACRNLSSGELLDPVEGIGSMGGLTIADGRLWFGSGAIVPGSLDLQTGEPLVVPEVQFAGSPRRGSAIVAVDDEWLLFGGRRLFATIDRWTTGERGMGFTLVQTQIELEEGTQVVLGADVIGESIFAPVFDEALLIAASEFPERGRQPVLQAFDRGDLVTRVASAKDFERSFLSKRAPYRFDSLIRGEADKLPAGGRWPEVQLAAFDAALAANLVLIVHPRGGQKSELEDWQLSALSRTDGHVVWTIGLPCRPVWNGLSVAGDGSILLSLWDGSIASYRDGTKNGMTSPAIRGQ